MPLGSSTRRHEPLHVLLMAGALVLAAFLGGALGLLWHAAGDWVEAEQGAAQEAAAD